MRDSIETRVVTSFVMAAGILRPSSRDIPPNCLETVVDTSSRGEEGAFYAGRACYRPSVDLQMGLSDLMVV